MICRQRTHLNTGPAPALQPAPQPQPQPVPRKRRNLKRKKDVTATSLLTKYTLISQNIKRTHTPQHQEVSYFRKPLEVGLKLAIRLRHLATGETYTSLQYHWLVGRITICKFFKGLPSHPCRIPGCIFVLPY